MSRTPEEISATRVTANNEEKKDEKLANSIQAQDKTLADRIKAYSFDGGIAALSVGLSFTPAAPFVWTAGLLYAGYEVYRVANGEEMVSEVVGGQIAKGMKLYDTDEYYDRAKLLTEKNPNLFAVNEDGVLVDKQTGNELTNLAYADRILEDRKEQFASSNTPATSPATTAKPDANEPDKGNTPDTPDKAGEDNTKTNSAEQIAATSDLVLDDVSIAQNGTTNIAPGTATNRNTGIA